MIKKRKAPEQVPGSDYFHLFQRDKIGSPVFEELCRVFYDVESYTKGDSHETAYKEGGRAVMAFIIAKMAQAQNKEDDTSEDDTSISF